VPVQVRPVVPNLKSNIKLFGFFCAYIWSKKRRSFQKSKNYISLEKIR